MLLLPLLLLLVLVLVLVVAVVVVVAFLLSGGVLLFTDAGDTSARGAESLLAAMGKHG